MTGLWLRPIIYRAFTVLLTVLHFHMTVPSPQMASWTRQKPWVGKLPSFLLLDSNAVWYNEQKDGQTGCYVGNKIVSLKIKLFNLKNKRPWITSDKEDSQRQWDLWHLFWCPSQLKKVSLLQLKIPFYKWCHHPSFVMLIFCQLLICLWWFR